MKHIVFIEGVSGVGKTTTVIQLADWLTAQGYRVKIHLEGDAFSPLDLCWISYLPMEEYKNLISQYPDYADRISSQIVDQNNYVLLRYRIDRKPLFPEEVDMELHRKEFCFNPENSVSLDEFTKVFQRLWVRYAQADHSNLDFEIFDATLVSHMTNDLIRNYHAPKEKMVQHINTLIDAVQSLQPRLYYFYTDNLEKRVTEARIARKQKPLTSTQLQFWKDRESYDKAVISQLKIACRSINVSAHDWDASIQSILDEITHCG